MRIKGQALELRDWENIFGLGLDLNPGLGPRIYRVSKKMLVSGKMAITPLWKDIGEEVIPFLKTTGSELSDEHKSTRALWIRKIQGV